VRICFFGDSFINGTGDDECLGWVGRLCAMERKAGNDLTIYNLGVRGDTSADIRRRWRIEAEARLPQDCDGRLVFSFGFNDCARLDGCDRQRVSTDDTQGHSLAVFGAAASWRPTLVIGPLPVARDLDRNKRVAQLSDRMGELCDRLSIPYFDALAFVADHYEAWREDADVGDGVHPNAGSYTALAAAVHAWAPWNNWFGR